MQGYHFISYSPLEALDFAHQLSEAVESGSSPRQVWLDKRDMKPGDWDVQIAESISGCESVLFIMTPDSVQHNSLCKEEWTLALKYKKPIIPLKLHPQAELPFRLGSRQYIDFTGDFQLAITQLRRYLEWLSSPEGVLQTLKYRLADARRDLRRNSDQYQEMRILDDIALLELQIAQQEQIVATPLVVAQRIQDSIASRIEQERQIEQSISYTLHRKVINPPPGVAPSYFQNRHLEMKLIMAFLRDDTSQLMTVVGRGGIGKTALVCRLLIELEIGELPDNSEALEVNGIVYLSAIGSRRVTAPNLYADLSKLLPAETAVQLEVLYKQPGVSTEDKMRALLTALPHGRIVVLMDNFEDVVDAQTRNISDPELDEMLRALLTLVHHPVKVILTTRIAPRTLALVQPARQKWLHLDEGLKPQDAESVLRAMDVDGKLGLQSASAELLHEACQRTKGYPRALEAIFSILAADRDTSLEEMLSNTASILPDHVVEVLVGEAFSRLDASTQQVIQALAIYARPVTPAGVDYLLQPYLPSVNSTPVLARLVNMQFVRKELGRYYLHPIDREYALSRVPTDQMAEQDLTENLSFTQVELLHRGANYFQQIRLPREGWKKLNDLEPQLAEIELSIQGHDYNRAARVLLDIDRDYICLWGYYRLSNKLHEQLEDKLSDLYLKQASLGNLGNTYRILGYYRKSILYLEQALAIAREIGDLTSQGKHLDYLGLCSSNLGQYQQAARYLEEATAIAREMGDLSNQARYLGHLGDRYSELGQLSIAVTYHKEALAVARQCGARRNEEDQLGLLGRAYCQLADTQKAFTYLEQALGIAREVKAHVDEAWRLSDFGIYYARFSQIVQATEYFKQALAMSREISDRFLEGTSLRNLAELLIDQGRYKEATQYALDCRQIGRQTDSPQLGQSSNRLLALVSLYTGDLPHARGAAEESCHYDGPRDNHAALVLLGIIAQRQGDRDVAQQAFTETVEQVDALLAHNQSYLILDSKGLALCGLALCEDNKDLSIATDIFRAARTIAREPGVIGRVERLFDALAQTDRTGLLRNVRATALGQDRGE